MTAVAQISNSESGSGTRGKLNQVIGFQRYASRADAAAATIPSGVGSIVLDGYASAGDGGGAVYKRVGSAPSHALYFQSAGGIYWEIVAGTFDVRAAGALTGVANAAVTTAAVKAVRDWMCGVTQTITGLSDPRLTRKMVFGPGHYVINEAEAFLTQAGPVSKAVGYNVEGAGMGITVVEYAPTTPGGYLINNTKLLGFLFRNITFLSNNAANSFAFHLMSGGNTPQDFRHENCEWAGSWKRYYEFSGTNNNSEGWWTKCRFTGFVESGLYTTNDQNLNYVFVGCDVLLTVTGSTSCFIDAVAGGHFKFLETDFSGTQNAILFKLQGTSHAQGVCFFECRGCRFELKSTNVKVLESSWPQGTVTFEDCDWSSQSGVYTSTTVAFEFTYATTTGPQIKFNGCSIIGTIKINHSTNGYNAQPAFSFRNCDFVQQTTDIQSAFNFASSTNDGSHPFIELENCRTGTPLIGNFTAWAASTAYTVGNQRRNGKSVYTCTVAGTSAGSGGPTGKGSAIVDGGVTWSFLCNTNRDYQHNQCLNWRQGRGAPRKRYAVIRNAGGIMPTFADGDFEVVLPANAIVVSAKLYAPAGAYSSGNTTDFKIQTWEASPTVFATVSSGALSAGFNNDWTGFFDVGTDILKRTLRLTIGSTVNQTAANALALVEYIA